MKIQNIIFILFIIGFTSCNNNKTNKIDEEMEVGIDANLKEDVALHDEKDVVFYNMFSPVDLTHVIDAKTAYFNSTHINSLNNITKYSSSQKIALNTGVFGADLSYLWMFEQTQQALSYLSAIQHLTSKLGIPDAFVKSTFKLAEASANEQDSLISVVRNAYNNTDKFLKESDRQSAAVLILLGGWIETLHIAVNMYNEPNPVFASKILTQKYSLGSLINMVQNTQDDMIMSEYLLLLRKLQDAFDAIEVQLKPEDIEIDTINKRITIKNSSNLVINPDEFKELKQVISKIRNHIIS